MRYNSTLPNTNTKIKGPGFFFLSVFIFAFAASLLEASSSVSEAIQANQKLTLQIEGALLLQQRSALNELLVRPGENKPDPLRLEDVLPENSKHCPEDSLYDALHNRCVPLVPEKPQYILENITSGDNLTLVASVDDGLDSTAINAAIAAGSTAAGAAIGGTVGAVIGATAGAAMAGYVSDLKEEANYEIRNTPERFRPAKRFSNEN